MMKREHKAMVAANDSGRGLLDLFREVPARSGGADMIAERLLPGLGRGESMPRSLALKLECLEHRFAGEPIALP